MVEYAITTSTRGIYSLSSTYFLQIFLGMMKLTESLGNSTGNSLNAEKMLTSSIELEFDEKIRRVCRSTPMAEGYALSNAVKHGLRTRAFVVDMSFSPLCVSGKIRLSQRWVTSGTTYLGQS